jgi:hypothetical protein
MKTAKKFHKLKKLDRSMTDAIRALEKLGVSYKISRSDKISIGPVNYWPRQNRVVLCREIKRYFRTGISVVDIKTITSSDWFVFWRIKKPFVRKASYYAKWG